MGNNGSVGQLFFPDIQRTFSTTYGWQWWVFVFSESLANRFPDWGRKVGSGSSLFWIFIESFSTTYGWQWWVIVCTFRGKVGTNGQKHESVYQCSRKRCGSEVYYGHLCCGRHTFFLLGSGRTGRSTNDTYINL